MCLKRERERQKRKKKEEKECRPITLDLENELAIHLIYWVTTGLHSSPFLFLINVENKTKQKGQNQKKSRKNFTHFSPVFEVTVVEFVDVHSWSSFLLILFFSQVTKRNDDSDKTCTPRWRQRRLDILAASLTSNTHRERTRAHFPPKREKKTYYSPRLVVRPAHTDFW